MAIGKILNFSLKKRQERNALPHLCDEEEIREGWFRWLYGVSTPFQQMRAK
jgi:hypothetical protein